MGWEDQARVRLLHFLTKRKAKVQPEGPVPHDQLDGFKVITFDCYGTLIDWESGILPVLRRVLAAHGKHVDDATLLELYGDFEQLSEQGAYMPYREVLASVVRQFGDRFGFEPRLRSPVLPESLPDWKPGPTLSCASQLKSRFRLAILSNIDDDLFSATRPQLGVEFDEIVTAQQARAYKPSRKVFELMMSRLNLASGSHLAHWPEYLSRCNSRPIAGDFDSLGQSPFSPSWYRRRKIRRRQTRSDSFKLGGVGCEALRP